MVRLFMLYAILIFAKKAPKMISELLKLKGEGTGLKGLNIKNKMGEAALVGDHVKKGLTKAQGRAEGTLGGGLGAFIRSGGDLKAALRGAITGGKNGSKIAGETGSTKGIFGKQANQMGLIAGGGKPSFWDRAKGKAQDVENRINDKGYNESAKANMESYNKHADKLRAMYGNKKANEILAKLGPIDFNDATAVGKRIKDLKDNYTDVFHQSRIPGNDAKLSTDADARYVKENLLSERKKLYDSMNAYQSRIEELERNVNPETVKAIAGLSSAQTQLTSIDSSIENLDNNIAVAKNLAANAINDKARAAIETRISELRSQKANYEIEKTRVQSQIDVYQAQITSDQSYEETQNQIASVRAQRDREFDDAMAKHLFEAYDDTPNGNLNLGIGNVNVENVNDLLSLLNDPKFAAKNENVPLVRG